ncbi:MAG: chemotaxis protein CheW [Burkholderiales bacterium]|nr:chemotaxis protein CheW [Burkholderiales bacterium]
METKELAGRIAQGGANEFLTFRLGEEEYGIDILKVQEIRGYDTVTRIANTPAFLKGVINLRGSIVPIVDLRIKFALGEPTYDQFTVVIILNVGGRVVGIVVDSVSDVLTLAEEQIRPAPDFSAVLATQYVKGLGAIDERMLILVDIEALIGSADMGLFEASNSSAAAGDLLAA